MDYVSILRWVTQCLNRWGWEELIDQQARQFIQVPQQIDQLQISNSRVRFGGGIYPSQQLKTNLSHFSHIDSEIAVRMLT